MYCTCASVVFFFFNDTATTEIYTLSLHDALPIFLRRRLLHEQGPTVCHECPIALFGGNKQVLKLVDHHDERDRKSTRLNSSHANISYAVFCLKKKKKHALYTRTTSSSCSLTLNPT